jgi:hypothetical protein
MVLLSPPFFRAEQPWLAGRPSDSIYLIEHDGGPNLHEKTNIVKHKEQLHIFKMLK